MNVISETAALGPWVDIETSVKGSRVVVGSGAVIDNFVKIKFAGGVGDVLIGPGVYLNSGVVIYSGNGVSIGAGSLIAANTTLAAANHEYRSSIKTIISQRFMPSKGGIFLGEDCWVGANCVLLDGTKLERGCIVAAGSVVRGEWPAYSILAGNPLKIIGYREAAWEHNE